MTPAQLNAAIRQRYNAVGDSFFSDDMVWDIIYQASMELANEAFVIQRKYTTTSVASQREYEFPTSTIAIRRVAYNGIKVDPVSIDQNPDTSTTEVTGRPWLYAIWNDQIELYPTPSASGDTIEIYTYNEPQPVEATSTLEVPSEYHPAMIDYGLSVFYAKDGNPSMSQYHERKWEKSVEKIKRTEAKKKRGDQFAVVRDQEDAPNLYGQLVRG